MTWLYIAGLVWLGCAAVVVLGLCVAAHGATPPVEELETTNGQSFMEDHDHGSDFLREAA